MNLKIQLYRHGKPCVSETEKISGRDFVAWVQCYDAAGLEASQPRSIEKQDASAFTSDLTRSQETGLLLFTRIVPDPIFTEADASHIRFPDIRLAARYWSIIARLLWLFGIGETRETYPEAKARAQQAAELLEQTAQQHGIATLIGHGFFNHLLRKVLQRKGWRVVMAEGHGYLQRTLLEYPV